MTANHPLFGVFADENVERAMLDVLRSGQIASGPNVAAFEAAFAHFLGYGHTVGTSDMSSAIAIALRIAGVSPGDEVVCSPFACLSTTAPLALAGARPVWADMNPDTASISVKDVANLIGPRTRAVLLYHVCGYPGPAEELSELCRRRGIALIEDCDNALGAHLAGRPVGSFADYSIYSFYPNRQINALEGGMLVCARDEDAVRARRLRKFGIDPTNFRDACGEINPSADVPELGWSAPLSNISAATALAQIGTLAERMSRTRRNAARLANAVDDVAGVAPVTALPGAEPCPWVLLVRSPKRERMLSRLKEQGVQASGIHFRNDLYSGFASRRDLPGVDAFSATAFGLPCGWWLSDGDIDEIAEAVRRAAE